MAKKDSPLVQVFGGIFLGIYFWPEFKEVMLKNFFCAPLMQNTSEYSWYSYCDFMWVFFYVIMPLITFFSFLPWILKVWNWFSNR